MKRVLVTGATGFVGRTLCETLASGGMRVRAALRSGSRGAISGVDEEIVLGNIDGTTNWDEALDGIDCVVHLAARVHVMGSQIATRHLYEETNAIGTARFAERAAAKGVNRFVFLSSVKVNGEQSGEQPFGASDVPNPMDAYGSSKLIAEQRLFAEAARSNMSAIAIRPPLVYGPGVKANFLRLLSWVNKGVPLPFGAVNNRRSLVSVWNLCDLIRCVLESPQMPSRAFMVSDGRDLSTPDLVRCIAAALDRRPRLLNVPEGLLRLLGAMTGKSAEVSRLCGSLTVDIEDTRRQFGWTPPISVEVAIARTVAWYLEEVERVDT